MAILLSAGIVIILFLAFYGVKAKPKVVNQKSVIVPTMDDEKVYNERKKYIPKSGDTFEVMRMSQYQDAPFLKVEGWLYTPTALYHGKEYRVFDYNIESNNFYLEYAKKPIQDKFTDTLLLDSSLCYFKTKNGKYDKRFLKFFKKQFKKNGNRK